MTFFKMASTKFTLTDIAKSDQVIKASKFIAVAGPVASEQAARTFIAAHSDAEANHNCWAWRVGQAYRFSDDGEPGGTAGKPILQMIDGQSLDSVAVVVTRWFGGTLLGAGGLIRAYGGTAANCLRSASRIEIVPAVAVTISCLFSDLALVKARLGSIGSIRIDDETFVATGAVIAATVPEAEVAAVVRAITDMTSGRASISPAT